MSAALHTLPAVAAGGLGCRWRRRRRPSATLRAASSVGTASVAVSVNAETQQQRQVGVEEEEKRREDAAEVRTGRVVEALYDDGFGGVTVKDYFAAARAVSSDDGGPPRWFCPVDAGRPAVDNAPLLLFLPGTDGVGMGLILHHKSLGRVFEVRCLHIPVNDRTPFEGLLQIVENSIKYEHAMSPNRPIYLVGDSFGGCLALSVAARDPLKMAMVSVENNLSPPKTLQKLSDSLTSMLPLLSELADIIPRDTLFWKLKLLKSGAAYANSRLHAVQAEVLLLASGNDNLLPSGEEADRLFKSLKNCRVRYFKDNGHTLLLEDGVNLLSVIKGVNMYRRGRQRDPVTDYIPPTLSEFKKTFDEDHKLFHLALSPVMLSTLKNGKIVRGLTGVPDQGPVLFVGYHALMGIELSPLYEEFLREKRTSFRGMAHPILFGGKHESSRQELSRFDTISMYGGLPVTAINMYRLFERNQFVLLYPGGVREALHRKGEAYKLFWPDQPEFVRMAARFGVTIIPFGFVGEDDVLELVADYNDQKNIPYLREWIESINREAQRVRDSVKGEDGNQDVHIPALLPKVPGRFYYLFGKPIEMKGMDNVVRDRKSANEVYLHIKSEVESLMSYLKRKREEDPYRSIAQRAVYQASWAMATLSLPLHSQIALWRQRRRRHDLFERISSCHQFKHAGWRLQVSYKGLETLYDDGYQKAKDLDYYYRSLGELVEHDSGPPRLFCPVDAGSPIEDAPLMLYLPGVDGMGMGLFMHHKALGRIFELRCMHIPFHDRTPFEELVEMVEDVVRAEHATSPNKPIHLLGTSFGGCIALAVAARNPCIDLVLVLVNPATSFEKSDIKQLLSVSSPLSDRARIAITSLLNYNIDNEVDMALSSMKSGRHPLEALNRLTSNISSFLKHSNILNKIPEDTLGWKMKLIQQAASYANCRLESVSAEVLLLVSCADRLLPSKSEADRLQRMLPKCKVFFFENHGHSLLLEYGVHVSSIIKCTSLYRHSRRYHRVFDYIPPSATELKEVEKAGSDLRARTCPAMFSTMGDGVEGPVLLVGNHMLLGIELISLATEFLRRKGRVLRGIAHPLLFPNKTKTWSEGHDFFDFLNLWGGVPMTYKYIYQLLAAGEFVLLYPGGHREALHCKGEEHRLFWPDQTEFVRMAAQFNATIVPFGVVGEDDLMELLCTFEDIRNAPFGKEIMQAYSNHLKLRDIDHEVFFPGVYLKIPGRFYYRFGKPIPTKGMQAVMTDKQAAGELYLHVKSEVKAMIAYLLEKREEDKFRSILPRILYQLGCGHDSEIPSTLLTMSMSIALHAVLPPAAATPRRRPTRLRASSTEAPASGEKGQEDTDRKSGTGMRRRRRRAKKVQEVGLEALYDDGFGEATCGPPAVHAPPLLLFLPGIDGVGMELIMQHKSLGKVFEVRCLHIPVNDRTPYEGLLQIMEESVKYEHNLSPNRPIYIIGDSFGGCLALSLASRNPEIDLVLILAILPLLEMVPSNLPVTLPHLLRYLIGDPLKMAMVSIQNNTSPQDTLESFSDSLSSMLPLLSEFGHIVRMDTLVWKLKLLMSGVDYTNSRLNAVQAEILLLASGNDNLPPSGEADRLFKALKSCKVRYFRTSSDRLLMESSFNLLTVIKGASMYRQGKQRDTITDFLPPTISEFKRTFGEDFKLLHHLLSPVMLSTLRNGKIVRGLAGVPDKGPVLLVGYHQLLAMEITSMAEEFLREKKAVLRTLAHPVFFVGNYEILRQELSFFDVVPLYGGVQVSPINTYRLFERDEFVLLYPGGIREALHRKDEDYQLFWPDQPEFVRMAAQFGVTVIPFGCVGEDDMLEIVLDYNELKNIPYIRETIESFNQDCPGVRSTVKGEEGNQVLHLPAVLPKLPGRLYYLFGKPIEMKGMDGVQRDRESANQLYLDIKSEVENIMSYLKRKREQDPYRSITARTFYQATWGVTAQIPTFEP
uniref:Serine aminopeptidase S33 domain-containing protein n=1 Tax=Oryza barthii TaxID=65489 RepID=A0A0D3ENR0_9ORYZ